MVRPAPVTSPGFTTPSPALGKIRTPRTVRLPWDEAHQLAQEEMEPMFVPLDAYADDRGWSLMNLLAGAMTSQGQLNFSAQYPGVIKAWHRHDKQTDFWCCVQGHLKAGVWREDDNEAWMVVMGERRPGVLIIPPPLWHGVAAVGPTISGLLYYVTHQYDPSAPDEYRRAWDSITGFPWTVQHG